MDDKQFESLKKDLEAIKRLLALILRSNDVGSDVIAEAMGISSSRLRQIVPLKKQQKSGRKE